MPETFAPPVQRQPLEEFRPYRAAQVVQMIDADAPSHFVRDISPSLVANWRWAQKRPTIRLFPQTGEGLGYSIDFTLPEENLKGTGPVTMSFWVGDHLLERVRYTEPGQKTFVKPIPPEWIAPGQELLIAAEIDKLWRSAGDGATQGFILTSIGLTQP